MDDFRRGREIRRLQSCLEEISLKLDVLESARTRLGLNRPLLKPHRQLIIPEIAEIMDHRRFLFPNVSVGDRAAYLEKSASYRILKREISKFHVITGELKLLLIAVMEDLKTYLEIQKERVTCQRSELMSSSSAVISIRNGFILMAFVFAFYEFLRMWLN